MSVYPPPHTCVSCMLLSFLTCPPSLQCLTIPIVLVSTTSSIRWVWSFGMRTAISAPVTSFRCTTWSSAVAITPASWSTRCVTRSSVSTRPTWGSGMWRCLNRWTQLAPQQPTRTATMVWIWSSTSRASPTRLTPSSRLCTPATRSSRSCCPSAVPARRSAHHASSPTRACAPRTRRSSCPSWREVSACGHFLTCVGG